MIDDTKQTEEVVDAVVEEVPADGPVEGDVAQAPASLSIQDLASLRNIIDVASQRGAFRTNEFQVVGATYAKLDQFLAAVAPAQEAQPEADNAATGE